MTDTPQVAAARIEAERARAQLLETLQAIEQPFYDTLQKLTPKHLMREAWDGAKDKGADLVEDAVDAVMKRPVTASGIVAGLALFLAREPLLDLAGKLIGSGSAPVKKVRKPRPAKPKQKHTETVQ